MSKPLSPEIIAARMTEWRNLKVAHERDRKRTTELEAENKQLKLEIAALTTKFETIITTQAARIEELETMVFGRKPSGDTEGSAHQKPKQPKQKGTNHARSSRTGTPHRRPIPPADTITNHEHHPTDTCHRCGHTLTDKREAIRYEEDIVLAALTPGALTTTTTEHTIESGWCSHCGQYSSAKDLRGQVVTLGPIVRSFIVYLVTHARLSFSQTTDLLRQVFHFQVTEAEIAVVLADRRNTYLPVYEQLKTNIREGPAHMDETSYPIQSEQGAGYAWVMTGADGTAAEHDVVFKLADGRGKGHAEGLVGEKYGGVGITDRYAGYKQLFGDGNHQICWAHLHRNARDITRLQCLSETVRVHVTRFYRKLAKIYATVRDVWAQTYDKTARTTVTNRLLKQITSLCKPHELDPKKLQDLKAGILEYQDCLFVCLTEPNVPPDNNKAERSLRKLVLKRKNSFGVKTNKGARTMEVLFSICQSLHNRDKDNLLKNLHEMATMGIGLEGVATVS